MANKEEAGLSISEILRHISYDPETGRFTRLIAYGRAKVGSDPVCTKGTLYGKVAVLGRRLYAHRLGWLLSTGAWPPAGMVVDHKNRNKFDNRLTNLRIGSQRMNAGNAEKSRNNKCGLKGVSQYGKHGRWRATIFVNRKQVNLGTFETKEGAAQAYRIAATKVFGEFACC